MATETSQFTSPIQVRSQSTTLQAGLISAIVAGSIAIGGFLYGDRGTNRTALHYGSGAYMVYTDSISGSGAVTCSNTGGLYKYTSCYLMNPLTVTGVVMRLDLQMYNSPNAANAYCVSTTVGSTTATGVVFFRNRATWTGAVLVNSTGSIAVAPHAGIRCWFSKTPGTVKANLRVWMTDFYVP